MGSALGEGAAAKARRRAGLRALLPLSVAAAGATAGCQPRLAIQPPAPPAPAYVDVSRYLTAHPSYARLTAMEAEIRRLERPTLAVQPPPPAPPEAAALDEPARPPEKAPARQEADAERAQKAIAEDYDVRRLARPEREQVAYWDEEDRLVRRYSRVREAPPPRDVAADLVASERLEQQRAELKRRIATLESLPDDPTLYSQAELDRRHAELARAIRELEQLSGDEVMVFDDSPVARQRKAIEARIRRLVQEIQDLTEPERPSARDRKKRAAAAPTAPGGDEPPKLTAREKAARRKLRSQKTKEVAAARTELEAFLAAHGGPEKTAFVVTRAPVDRLRAALQVPPTPVPTIPRDRIRDAQERKEAQERQALAALDRAEKEEAAQATGVPLPPPDPARPAELLPPNPLLEAEDGMRERVRQAAERPSPPRRPVVFTGGIDALRRRRDALRQQVLADLRIVAAAAGRREHLAVGFSPKAGPDRTDALRPLVRELLAGPSAGRTP